MRRYRSALILLLILAVMLGGYFFYTVAWPLINPDAAGEETGTTATGSTEYVKLVDRTTDELQELTVKYLSEEYVALKEKFMEKPEGGGTEREVTRWRLTNRSDFPVDASKLSTAASNFCVITTSKVVEEYASDLAQYGFGSPASALITGKFTDGTSLTLEIGNKNPTNDAYYIRKDGDSAVYLGSSYSSEKMMIKKTEIADLALFTLVESDISRIKMTRGGAPLFETYNEGEYQWELESPVIAPFNATAQGQIIEAVAEVAAVEYTEIGAEDLTPYGLDKPRYTLLFELAGGGEPIELVIGAEKAVRSTVYAMLGGTDDVFVLSLTNFSWLDKPMKEFIDVFAYIVNINDVSHIQADFDGRTVQIDIEADMDNDTEDVFIVDGVDVTNLNNDKDRSIFRLFYQALIGVTIYDLETDAKPAGSPAEITFLYELEKEPHSMLVEFIPKDERLYYVFRNKEYAGIVVEKRLFDKAEEGLRPMYATLKAAMDAMQ